MQAPGSPEAKIAPRGAKAGIRRVGSCAASINTENLGRAWVRSDSGNGALTIRG
jgi:hypothetical protein